ncbi:lysylphosphatidylglycerol synthase domain-containing protein [Saccharibacter sp. 17.LH.SD]|uniref:lysylphosphatidylglycerol synthase domain-containing protein n=1 Tax=Saccharibacter sp. 17.LH.SD TaxID=2689393 RepID=UPI0019264BA2|nr:lysylphosphatidylglycerol synthase domain-containing protein [Saccharibacter sp. 17.LH.SD]
MKKTIPFILTFIGIVLFCFLTLRTGLHSILLSLAKVGIGGFVALILCQLIVNLVLGLAWKASIADISLSRLTASRAVRDAANSCLPFSQLGGIFIGIRSLVAGHPRRTTNGSPLGWPEGVAANVIDVTTELLGQVAFIFLSLLCLIGYQDADRFIWPVIIGIIVLTIAAIGFIWTQQRGGNILKRIIQFMAGQLSAERHASLTGGSDDFQAYMEASWNRPLRMLCGAFLHFICWLASAGITWFSAHLLGATTLFFLNAVAIEGVVCAIMSVGFLVPGALGIQEGAYVTLGLIFGLPADISLSISLLRRGRDIIIGVPVLLLWQFYELRRLRHSNSHSSS